MNGYNLEYIQKLRIHELRDFARQMGIPSPTTMKKETLIEKLKPLMTKSNTSTPDEKSNMLEGLDFYTLLTLPNSNIINELIMKTSDNENNELSYESGDLSNTLVMKKSALVNNGTPYAHSSNDFIGFNLNVCQNQASYGNEITEMRGYLDIHPNGYGIVRKDGFFPTANDAYVTLALIKKYGLKKGDWVYGKVKYILENKPRVMYDILSIDNGDKVNYNTNFDEVPYTKGNDTFYLDKFEMKITIGERLYIKNMSIADAVKLGFDLVDENGVDVKLINLKALPEEYFQSHQKMQIINCAFNKTESDAVDAMELIVERVKREFERNKSNVIIIYNFSELIRMYNVAMEGCYAFDKFNVKALNKLRNIMYTAKYADAKRNVTVICIDKLDVVEDVKTLVSAEFMPLFNTKYDFNDFKK
ncbi:MAG: Rho termination factor N-terminal domain-containing protein [Firmicutes bacterium]|nr:Rho termination factor N-terminal domain-containing protein [Bacillota bacterium]MDY5676902.1 Rho termination factor N-terminal domain-containing protein [Eubacteriales bacterium]